MSTNSDASLISSPSSDPEISLQSTSKSSQNEVKEWHDAWKQGDNKQVEIEGLDERGAFWMKLKSAAERKVGAAEAERFCKTFQRIHSKLVNEELSSDVTQNILKLSLDSHKCCTWSVRCFVS